MRNIAIFASGEGSNAETIIRYFKDNSQAAARVVLVVFDRWQAEVRKRAGRLGVPCVYLSHSDFDNEALVLDLLETYKVDVVVLAGFLKLVPPYLVKAYAGRMVNIHPALLPLHSGKGMYGMHVHRDVVASGEKETGITVHLVDEHYDKGQILLQKSCPVFEGDTPETVAERVHALEYEWYPVAIEQLIKSLK